MRFRCTPLFAAATMTAVVLIVASCAQRCPSKTTLAVPKQSANVAVLPPLGRCVDSLLYRRLQQPMPDNLKRWRYGDSCREQFACCRPVRAGGVRVA